MTHVKGVNPGNDPLIIYQTRRRFNCHLKCTVQVSTSFTSLLHGEPTSAVTTASK